MTYIYQRLEAQTVGKIKGVPSKNIFLFFAFLPLFLLSALRVEVGTDYSSYASWFHRVASGAETYFEPGFTSMIHFISSVTHNEQWLFAVSAFMTLALVFISIKRYSVNPALSVYLFSTMSFLFSSFNGIRQYIAIAIMLLAFGYLIERKWFRYLLLLAAATFFHTTALVMGAFYLLLNIKYTVLGFAVVAFLASLSIVFRDELLLFMTDYYPMYQENDDFLYNIVFSEIFIATSAVMLAMMLFFFKKGIMSYSTSKHKIIFNSIFYILILHTCLAWVPAINRISLYLDIYLILIIPYLLSYIKSRQWRVLITILIMLGYFSYTMVSFGINNSHDVLPYQSVINAEGGI